MGLPSSPWVRNGSTNDQRSPSDAREVVMGTPLAGRRFRLRARHGGPAHLPAPRLVLRSLAVVAAAASLVAGAVPVSAAATPTARAPLADPGSVLVRFGSSRAAAEATLRSRGVTVAGEIPGTGFVRVSTGGRSLGEMRRELAPWGAVVEPNLIRRAFAQPDDPGYLTVQAAYMQAIGLPAAWDLTTGDEALVVAVLDTGVQLDHPDLASRLVPGIDVVNSDAVAADDHGHGTMVAGIVAAQTDNGAGVAGVTWRGRIMPVKVLDSMGSGTDADVAQGITWAADHGADVVNLSLGGPGSSKVLQAAVDHAVAKGAVVVAAAGNESTDEPHWPAAANGVVAVGATTANNTLASFSNFGAWVDLVAPGVGIASTALGGGYATASGTSFSSPIVAGVAALARAADPAASAADIAARLSLGAADLGLPGVDLLFGAGLVDALAMVVVPVLTSEPQPAAVTAPTPVASAPPPVSGYWMLGADGRVYAFGDARPAGEPSAVLNGVAARDIEPTRNGAGYWVLDERGSVFAYGEAGYFGAPGWRGLLQGESTTSLSATPTGAGYWIFTSRGRAFAFGDAALYGDMGGTPLNGPVIGSVSTPTGRGYYMVAADGGIFSFGDAKFHGSTGDKKLNAPVRGLVPDPDGGGYWLVAADGGVFAFDAGFGGSMGGRPLNAPITGMVAYGDGYLMVATDGGIFNFSDKTFVGSLGATPPARPIVSVAVLP
jgi:subtilisin family serine protease